jgi:hypothetical protein
MLSATAAEDPTEMKASGYVLGLHHLKDHWAWSHMFGARKAAFGGIEFVGTDEDMNRLHNVIFPEHGSRLSFEDLAEHFTETKIITTPLDFGDRVRDIYNEMEIELQTLTDRQQNDFQSELTIRLRARQKVELLKVPVIVEMAKDMIAEHKSVAIFINFTATLKAIFERLNPVIPCAVIQGGQTREERVKEIKKFQNDEVRIILSNTAAGGVSINLQDMHGKHPRASIISPSDNAKEILQVLGRIHRFGGMTPTEQHVLFAAGTIEEEVEANCRAKINRITIFNEGMIDKSEEAVDDPPIVRHNDPTQKMKAVKKKAKKTLLKAAEQTVTNLVETRPEHAEFSPSSFNSFEKCPGYRNRDTSSEASERGDRIHSAMKTDKLEDLEEKERHTAQIFKDYIDGVMMDHLPARPNLDDREVAVDIDLGGGLETYGTPDRTLGYGEEGLIYDYKSGYREVADAEENLQAWLYTIGTFQKYSQFKRITFTFLVPNRDEVLFHTFQRDDIPNLKLRANTVMRRAMEIDWSKKLTPVMISQLNPQPELCEYCAFQAQCPALGKMALLMGSKLAPGLPIPASPLVDPTRPKDIANLLRLVPLFEEWAKATRKEALRVHMEDGIDIPGFKRVERSTDRGVTSVQGTWAVVKDRISFDDFLDSISTVSIPKLEKFFAAKAPRGKKGDAKDELENRLIHADLMKTQGTIHYLKEAKK